MNWKYFAKRLVMLALMLVLSAVVLPTEARADDTMTVNPGNFEFRLHSVTCQYCKNVLSTNNSISVDEVKITINGSQFAVKYTFSLGYHTTTGGERCPNTGERFRDLEWSSYNTRYSCTSSFSTGQQEIPYKATQCFKHVISVSRGNNGHAIDGWTSNGNNQHTGYCNICRQTITQSCTGGSPNCTNSAKCSTCDGNYVNTSAHNWGSWKSNGDNTHTRFCSNNSSHKETKSCSGGTAATCMAKSVCGTCNAAYGDYADHAWGSWESNGDNTHTRVCATNADHKEKKDCSGGVAATCVAKSVCSSCKEAYGVLADHAWTGYESNGDGTHTRVCATNADHNVTANCSGGTATCTEPPVCTTCKESYGKELTHDLQYSNAEADHILEESCSRCNHAGTAALQFTAGGAQLSLEYTGNAHKPMKVVYTNWLGDQQHETNNIHYTGNTDVGTATGSFTDYGVAAVRTFTISPKALEQSMLSMDSDSGTYNGGVHNTPTCSLSYNAMNLEAGKDYTATDWPADMTNAGSKTVRLSGVGNYKGEITATYQIKPKAAKVSPLAGQEMTYGQDVPELKYEVTGLIDGEVPIVSGRLMPENTNAGTPAIERSTLTLQNSDSFLASNYTVGFESGITMRIHKAEAGITVSVQDQDYDGAPISADTADADVLYTYNGDGAISVKWYADNNGVIGEEISAPTDVGIYHVGVSAAEGSNYKAVAEVVKSFKILKIDPTLTGPEGKTLDYNLGAQELVSGVTSGGTLEYSMDGEAWNTDIPTGTDAGEYIVYWRVVGDRNYNDHEGGSVKATINTIPIRYTADNCSKVYDGNAAGITVTVSEPEGTTLLYKDAEGQYTLTEAPQYTDVGSYQVSFRITKKNYTTVTDERRVEITRRPVAVNGILAEDKIYDGTTEAKLDLSNVAIGNVVVGEMVNLESVTGTFDTKHAGSGKTVTLDAFRLSDDNYCLDTENSAATVTASIAPMDITVTITPNGGAYQNVTPAAVKVNETTPDALDVTLTYDGTANDGTLVTSETAVPTLAGTYTVTASISDSNYTLKGETSAAFLIAKAEQKAPVLTKQDETISKKLDGSISGIAANMEYRTGDAQTYTQATESTIENLGRCKYWFRYVETPNYNPSEDALMEIKAGRKLLVKVPAEQAGYTLTTTTPEVDWHGDIHVEFKLAEGYETTDAFQIFESNVPVWEQFQDDTLSISQIERDYEFTVTGIEDRTAPKLILDVSGEKWSALSGDDSFDDHTNKDLVVTLQASDNGSGVKSLEYLIASAAMTEEQLEKSDSWKSYTGKLTLSAEQNYMVYARATDASGNRSYAGSIGIVLDKTAPVITGLQEGGVYYTTQIFDVTDLHAWTVKLDGKAIQERKISGDPAETTQHILKARDEAGNETTLKLTMMPIDTLRKDLPTTETVELTDKELIKAIREKTAAVDTETATSAEKEKLNAILADCNALTEEILDAEAVIALIAKIPAADKLEPDNAEHLQLYVTANAAYDKLSACAQRMVGEHYDLLVEAYEALTDYCIIKGHNSKHSKPGWRGLTFVANGPVKVALEEGLVFFESILLDGRKLDPSNYTVKSGSTVVTLNREFLNKLDSGKHEIAFVYNFLGDKIMTEEAIFKIYLDTGNPSTGDDTNWMLLGGTAVASLLCAAMFFLLSGKKQGKYQH